MTKTNIVNAIFGAIVMTEAIRYIIEKVITIGLGENIFLFEIRRKISIFFWTMLFWGIPFLFGGMIVDSIFMILLSAWIGATSFEENPYIMA